MGHYDDCYAAEDEKQHKAREKRRREVIQFIRRDIQLRNVAPVLADILLDPDNYKSRIPRRVP